MNRLQHNTAAGIITANDGSGLQSHLDTWTLTPHSTSQRKTSRNSRALRFNTLLQLAGRQYPNPQDHLPKEKSHTQAPISLIINARPAH